MALFCGSKLRTPFQKPSHLTAGYNPFAGCGCLNYTSRQNFPLYYRMTEVLRLLGTSGDHLAQVSCSKPGSPRAGCAGPCPVRF